MLFPPKTLKAMRRCACKSWTSNTRVARRPLAPRARVLCYIRSLGRKNGSILKCVDQNIVLQFRANWGSLGSGDAMPLPLREKFTMLMPPSLFYGRRITEEARSGEPELAILAKLVPRGGTAIDVGANRGVFAYALTDIADRVVAFEPNPDYAFFARWMLRGRAEVHELALSEEPGRGTLYVPLSDQGVVLHLAGSLKRAHSQFRNIKTYDV